ncbi:MAG: zf-HC2 domain-containing protein [Syntrophales bacterium]|nr:zf-HC2 domain-containing protein [Syntrophales bacterium]MDD5643711.1 zf-HC2 domain-containing protein [Syntrophales bacterium]
MKTACEQVREQLSPWLDGELTAAENRQVAAHLEVCPDCSRELAVLQWLDAALGTLEAPVPARLPERVLDRLQPRRRYWWQSLAMAASLVIGIVLGGTLAQNFYPYSTKVAQVSSSNGEVLALDEFHDFPQGSLGAVMVSYQAEEINGS